MKLLLTKYLDYLKYEKNCSEHTLRNYSIDLKQFLGFLKKVNIVNIENVSHKHIRSFIVTRHRQGNENYSIARKVWVIRSFFSFLCRKGILKQNVAKLVNTPKTPKKLFVSLSIDEILALLGDIFPKDKLGIRDRAILETFYGTGVRLSELSGMNVPDMDLESEFVLVRGKGRKEREVPVLGKAVQAIKRYLAVRGQFKPREDALFLTDKGPIKTQGTRISTRSIHRLIKKYTNIAQVQKNVSPHTLRHAYATHLLDMGANIRDIQELLGHASLSTTQKYTHVSVEKLMEVYDKSHPRAG